MLHSKFKYLIAFSIFIFLLSGCGSEGGPLQNNNTATIPTTNTALLSWTPPTTNSDNSALIDLAGYKIYYGTTPGSYNNVVTLSGTGLTSFLIENLATATWYFTITAYNSTNVESSYSSELSKTFL